MTIDTIELGTFIVATLVSIAVGIGLFFNARAHERDARNLGAEIERAGIKLRQL